MAKRRKVQKVQKKVQDRIPVATGVMLSGHHSVPHQDRRRKKNKRSTVKADLRRGVGNSGAYSYYFARS